MSFDECENALRDLAKENDKIYYNLRVGKKRHRDEDSETTWEVYITGYSWHEAPTFNEALQKLKDQINPPKIINQEIIL